VWRCEGVKVEEDERMRRREVTSVKVWRCGGVEVWRWKRI
jgi:hypothetical protein